MMIRFGADLDPAEGIYFHFHSLLRYLLCMQWNWPLWEILWEMYHMAGSGKSHCGKFLYGTTAEIRMHSHPWQKFALCWVLTANQYRLFWLLQFSACLQSQCVCVYNCASVYYTSCHMRRTLNVSVCVWCVCLYVRRGEVWWSCLRTSNAVREASPAH